MEVYIQGFQIEGAKALTPVEKIQMDFGPGFPYEFSCGFPSE